MSDDTKDFQVPASDTKGHSVRITFRCPPQLHMQMEIILSSRKWPYRTDGEFLRHAMLEHCRRVMGGTGIQSLLPQIEGIARVVKMEEEQREFESVGGKVTKEATALSSAGHVKKARALADRVMAQVEKMEDQYWREKYMKELSGKLGYLMSKPASMKPGTFERDSGDG